MRKFYTLEDVFSFYVDKKMPAVIYATVMYYEHKVMPSVIWTHEHNTVYKSSVDRSLCSIYLIFRNYNCGTYWDIGLAEFYDTREEFIAEYPHLIFN